MLRYTSRWLCTAAAAGSAAGRGVHKAAHDAAAVAAGVAEQVQLHHALETHPSVKDGAVLDADGLPPVPEPSRPYTPPPSFPVRPRLGMEAPEYYSSPSAVGHPDPLAVSLSAGRSDPEWQWLKFLCFLCVMSTFGTWVYGVFFPQNMKWFKDEPWSSFRN